MIFIPNLGHDNGSIKGHLKLLTILFAAHTESKLLFLLCSWNTWKRSMKMKVRLLAQIFVGILLTAGEVGSLSAAPLMVIDESSYGINNWALVFRQKITPTGGVFGNVSQE